MITILGFTGNFDPIEGIPGSTFQTGANPASSLETFMTMLLGFFTVAGGIAFIIYFLVGALNYLTAQGDMEKVKKAQRYLTNALIGLIVIVLTWAIAGIIGLVLGFDFLDLVTLIPSIAP